MWNFFSENAIAVSAGVISLLALITTVYHGVATRKHFKLSVKPNLSINFGPNEEETFLHIIISNEGLGPAIIKRFVIVKNGEIIRPKNPTEITKLLEDEYDTVKFPTRVSLPHRDEALGAKKSITLLKIILDPESVYMTGPFNLLKK